MTLYQRGDVYVAESSITVSRDATFTGSNNIFALLTTEPGIRTFDSNSLAALGHLTLTGTGIAGIALVSAVCAAVVYSGTSQVDIVNLSTLARTNITTGAGTVFTNGSGQQVAGNPSTGFAMSTSATTSVRLINANTQTLSTLSPSILSGTTPSCVGVKSNNFLVGTSNGKIFEIATSGSVIQSITLPTSNNVGTTVTPHVSGISWSGPNVICTTNEGIGYVINWGASSIVSEFMCGDGSTSASQAPVLCTSVGGITILGRTLGASNSGVNAIAEYYIAGNNFVCESIYYLEGSSSAGAITGAGFDSYNNKAYVITADSSEFLRCRIFDVPNLSDVAVDTRIQYPANTDIAGRVINIRDNGPGKSQVESDQNISSGIQSINCSGGRRYTQLITNNLSGVNEKWDVREF